MNKPQPMEWVLLKPSTCALIRAHARTGAEFKDNAIQGPGGMMKVPLAHSTIAHLRAAQVPGESLDDTIERLFWQADGGLAQ